MTDGTPLEQDAPAAAADRLRLESALLEAQQEIRDRRLAMEVIQNELTRAREDLDAEREHHKEDAERFRVGLAQLRASADDAVADEQRARRELAGRLDDAEGTIAQLTEQLEASRASLARARDATTQARSDTERLLERLRTLADDLG